jgi:glycine cleavage system H protein
MSAEDLLYTKTHCWVRQESDGDIVVGITDFAQEQMTELTFVELPDVGETVSAGDEIAVVESVKAANDVYAPVSGTVTSVNDALSEEPELVNQDPFGRGWLFRMRPDDPADLSNLLDFDAYESSLPDEDDA